MAEPLIFRRSRRRSSALWLNPKSHSFVDDAAVGAEAARVGGGRRLDLAANNCLKAVPRGIFSRISTSEYNADGAASAKTEAGGIGSGCC